ncbi:synaptonemal complex protein 1-like [Passerculus sandwichensis]
MAVNKVLIPKGSQQCGMEDLVTGAGGPCACPLSEEEDELEDGRESKLSLPPLHRESELSPLPHHRENDIGYSITYWTEAHLVDNLREGDKERLKKKLPSVDRAVPHRYRTAKELIDTIEALLTFHIKGPMNNLKKQVENKTKCIEELQQENKVLKKKISAESKKSNTYEGKVNKLQLEMENMNKQHKEEIDIYQKDIETRKVNENKLCEEVENMRLLCDETAMIQRETDARCQHKITEMVALMGKHKNEYDKMVEEKDAELKVYKMKQQKQFSSERALENELSCLKRELSSLKEQLRAEMEEKVEFFIP